MTFLFLCVFVLAYLSVCVILEHRCPAREVRRRRQIPLKLESAVVSCLVWVLGPRPSVRAPSAQIMAEPFLQAIPSPLSRRASQWLSSLTTIYSGAQTTTPAMR